MQTVIISAFGEKILFVHEGGNKKRCLLIVLNRDAAGGIDVGIVVVEAGDDNFGKFEGWNFNIGEQGLQGVVILLGCKSTQGCGVDGFGNLNTGITAAEKKREHDAVLMDCDNSIC